MNANSGLNLAPGLSIPLHLANRHGLITGQTGTGKSVTLMRLAEQFSAAGSAVFLADVKGDLGMMSRTSPVSFLDAYGIAGAPFTASVQDLGSDLLSRALDLSDAQSGTLELAFHLAKEIGTPVHTKADLKLLLGIMLKNRERLSVDMGQVSTASVGVIQRALLRIDDGVLASPGFDVADLVQPGRISILRAERLYRSPRLYAALLMRTLNQLEQRLPEVGDLPAPRLAFFFDEAHLLFRDAPAALLDRVERTVRLIRSKGVGIYFASQSPNDVPEAIRDQCAHRVEHDRSHGVGLARVSTLAQDGRPLPSRVARIAPPACLTAAPVAGERVETHIPAPTGPNPVTARPGASDDVSNAIGSFCVAAVLLLCLGYTVLSLLGVPWQVALFMGAGAGIGTLFKLNPAHGRRRRH